MRSWVVYTTSFVPFIQSSGTALSFREMCGFGREPQFLKGKSAVPELHFFPLGNKPKTLKKCIKMEMETMKLLGMSSRIT